MAVTHKLSQLLTRVPQGSLLGPWLFTYYINDLSDSVNEGKLELYADDMMLHFVDNNVDVVVDGLNKALSEISLWCRNNKLTIHDGMSEAMTISHSPFCGPLRPIKLGDNIERCLWNKMSGAYCWLPAHLEHLCKSFWKKVRWLKRFQYLPTSTLEKIYFSSLIIFTPEQLKSSIDCLGTYQTKRP